MKVISNFLVKSKILLKKFQIKKILVIKVVRLKIKKLSLSRNITDWILLYYKKNMISNF